jgi:hypothetical protein
MQNASTSLLFGGPWRHGGWSIAAVAAAADDVAARVVHASDIDAADFGAVSDATGKTTVGARGEGEGTQAG